MTDIEINLKGLDQLLKALKGKQPTAKVGILGGEGRSDGSLSNSEIGAFHEFGTSKVPQRSFLRIPLTANLNKALEQSGAFDPETLREVVNNGTITPWLEKVAVVAEGIVLDAFDTGGNGLWPPSDMTHKKNKQTLIETQQLRNSISHEVKEAG
jgi:phage gpG-like protein